VLRSEKQILIPVCGRDSANRASLHPVAAGSQATTFIGAAGSHEND
jgi:hypothetical protein